MTNDKKAIADLAPTEEALPNPPMPEQPKSITVRVVFDGKVFDGMLYAVTEI